jgi:hypothetical protein
MKKMRTKQIFGTVLLFVITTSLNAQVTIGSLEDPAPSAVLDLNTGGNNRLGLLLPNVPLTSETDVTTTTAPPATGLMVYADGTGGLEAGVYVWNGTKWQSNNISGAELNVKYPVEDFTLNDVSIERWATGTLTASAFTPENSTLPYVSWQILEGADNLSEIIPSLTEYHFTGAKTGITRVQASSLDGGVSKEATVTVTQTFVNDVSITHDDPLRLTIGNGTTALAATVLPNNATRKTLNWTIQHPEIASVTGSGNAWQIEGLTIGETTLTATTTDESGEYDAINVKVYPKINPLAPIVVSEGAEPQAMPVPTTTPSASYTLADFTITSNEPAVAEYNSVNQTIEFGSGGTAELTIQFQDYPASATLPLTVTVITGCEYVVGWDDRCYRMSEATGRYENKPACPEGWNPVVFEDQFERYDWLALYDETPAWVEPLSNSVEVFRSDGGGWAWYEEGPNARFSVVCVR